jgi:HSP20 family molecular chaperone IbpA
VEDIMNQEVQTRGRNAPDSTAREEGQSRGREQELVLAPAVDIFENSNGITVQAEMPGVSKDRLNVQADRNSLLIEGDVVIDMPVGIEALYADVQATKYRRSFVLSGELEADKIEADLKDGVLTVRIPKRAEFRPRKIEVRAS